MINATPQKLVGRHILTAAPIIEPVSVEDFHLHSFSTSTQDAKVEDLLIAARQNVENWCGIALITQTWTLTYDLGGMDSLDDFWYTDTPTAYGKSALFLPRVLEIPRPPLLGITSIKYQLDDDTDVATTFAASSYYVSKPAPTSSTAPAPGRVMLRTGRVWPTGLRPIDSLVITHTCGYEAFSSAVPQALKEAILMWAAHLYENREGQRASNEGGAIASQADRGFCPPGVQSLLKAYRVVRA